MSTETETEGDHRNGPPPVQHAAAPIRGSGRQGGPTLRGRLLLLTLAVALPLLVVAGGLVRHQRLAAADRGMEALMAQARTLASLLDRDLADAARVLQALAGSEALARGDLDGFAAELRTTARAARAEAVSLIGADRKILLSTRWRAGERPEAEAAGPAVEALVTGLPRLGTLAGSGPGGGPLIALGLPVPAAAGMPGRRVLEIVLPRPRRLAGEPRPPAAMMAVPPPADAVWDALRPGSGLLPAAPALPDGGRMVAAFARVAETDYWVVISLAEAALAPPPQPALWSVVLIGAALLAASLLQGAVMARNMAASLQRLATPGDRSGAPRRSLREVNDLADILARQSAERERIVAEMRGLFEASPVGVIRADAGGRVQDANDAFLRMVGMTRADLAAGRVRWDDLTPPEWIGRDEAAIAEAARQGACTPYQKEFIRPDGTRLPVLLFFAFHDRATGAAAAFVVDLSGWAATEAALVRTHEQMRLAIGAARMFFWDWNILSGTVEWSDGLEAACGLPPGGFGGTIDVFRSLVHPEDLPRVEAALGRALGGEADYDTEFRMRRGDGGTRWLVARGTVLRDGTGKPVRMVGIDLDITDRKATEATLATSEARLRLAQQIGRIGVWEWDLRTGATFGSAEYRRIYGLPADAPMPDYAGWLTRVHPDDRAAADAAARGGLASGEYEQEFRILHPDGETRWIANRAVVQRGPDGQPVRFTGVNIDVTALRGIAATGTGDVALFRQLAASMPIFVFIADADGRNIFSNAFFQEYAGRSGAELLDDGWLQVLYPEDRARAAAIWALSVSTGEAYEAEYRYRRHRDGTWRWFLCRAVPQCDAEGQVLRWIGTCTDVDDARRAEGALAAVEARGRLAIEAADLGVWSWDLRTGAMDASARCLALYGLPPDGALDYDGMMAALHPEDRARTEAAIARAVADSNAYDVEHRVLLQTGEVRWLRATGRASFGPDGAALALRGVVADIDGRKRAEMALRTDNERLESRVAERTRTLTEAARELAAELRRREEVQAALLQAQKLEALGEFTGSVAHDFNNILAATLGGYRLMQRRVGDPRVLELIDHGVHAAERGAKLIAKLMAFARKEELQPAVISLADTLREAEDMVCHTAGRRVSCSFDIATDIWPVIVDPVRLETGLLNLAANARDAMPEGGTLTILARNARPEELPPELTAEHHHVLIAVADTGTGMDAATLQRATETFFTTKPRGQGTGLGLASVRTFVSQSAGALRLRSTVGKGTIVELFLPRAAVHWEAARESNAEVLDRSRHGDATLLLVDDDDGVRAVTAGMLRDLGYRVLEASSTEAAAALTYTEKAIDMLVTDVIMGGAPGPALAARLRAEAPDLRVLFITGFAGDAMPEGMPVLHKPFTDAALARAVLAGLGRLAAPDPAAAPPARSDRLRERLRRPELRDAYLRWQALRGSGPAGTLPKPSAFPSDDLMETVLDHSFLAEALNAGADGFRFLRVGRSLAERLGRPLVGETVGGADAAISSTLGGTVGAAYRRCADTAAPLYDYARFTQADGKAVLLERLVLPLAANGVDVTHVAGVALFTELDVAGTGEGRG